MKTASFLGVKVLGFNFSTGFNIYFTIDSIFNSKTATGRSCNNVVTAKAISFGCKVSATGLQF